MESLVQSLLGKGQEQVFETMKVLVEDAERVIEMEIDLKELTLKLEKLEDENQQTQEDD